MTRVLVVGYGESANAVWDALSAVHMEVELLDEIDLGGALANQSAVDLVVAVSDSPGSASAELAPLDVLAAGVDVPWVRVVAGCRSLAVGPAFSADAPCLHCVTSRFPFVPGPAEPPWPMFHLPAAVAAALDAPVGVARCTLLRLSRSPRAHILTVDPSCSCRSVTPLEVSS